MDIAALHTSHTSPGTASPRDRADDTGEGFAATLKTAQGSTTGAAAADNAQGPARGLTLLAPPPATDDVPGNPDRGLLQALKAAGLVSSATAGEEAKTTAPTGRHGDDVTDKAAPMADADLAAAIGAVQMPSASSPVDGLHSGPTPTSGNNITPAGGAGSGTADGAISASGSAAAGALSANRSPLANGSLSAEGSLPADGSPSSDGAKPHHGSLAALGIGRHQAQQQQQTQQMRIDSQNAGFVITPEGSGNTKPPTARSIEAALNATVSSSGDNGAQAASQSGAVSPSAATTGPAATGTPTTTPLNTALTSSFTATLNAPIASTPWQQQLGQQLVHLSQRGDQHMQLHLHPRELGPLQVSLRVDNQSAQAHFFSAHAEVRGAVEQAVPQLREALAAQGIALGEAMVGQQQQQQQHGAFATPNDTRPTGTTAPREQPRETATAPPSRGLMPGTGVDLYA